MSQQPPRQALFSVRTLLSSALITGGVLLLFLVCSLTIHIPCVTTYYDELPVYPDSTLVRENRSPLRWVGFAQPEHIWQTEDSVREVEAWFEVQVGGEPVVGESRWNGDYALTGTAPGTEIQTTVACVV